MVAFEQEVMAKKFDRFGWDRDMGTPEHDRMITDWMDTLQDYPLHEVQAACRKWVNDGASKMPTEGNILRLIKAERAKSAAEFRRNLPPRDEDQGRQRISRERAAELSKEYGFAPRKMEVKNDE